jgi:hypothetical protein
MELVDGFKSVHIGCWFPTHFIVTFPLDEVLELSSEYPRVFDFFDFVLFLSFYDDWRRWFVLL